MATKGYPHHFGVQVQLDTEGPRDPYIHHHDDGTTSLSVWVGPNQLTIAGTRNQLAQLQTYLGHAIADADALERVTAKSVPQSAFTM